MHTRNYLKKSWYSSIKHVTQIGFMVLLLTASYNTLTYADERDVQIHKTQSFKYERARAQLSYGSRIYKNNCQSCHGPIGSSYLSRLETPEILGLSGQQIVDRLIYYRDAETYGMALTGTALLMSRQVLFLNNDQINSIARYFEELNPISKLNLEKERLKQKRKLENSSYINK